MEISALTRTVVKHNHAIICPDGYVNSNVPGWTGCTVTVLISEAMGAGFCQNLLKLTSNGKLSGHTLKSQVFFYVISGGCTACIDGDVKPLTAGQYVYVPVHKNYLLDGAHEGTEILTFHAPYEQLAGCQIPDTMFGDANAVAGKAFMGDDALQLQVLLPEDLSFNIAVNIFTFEPGGHLPFVETHVMEHGLMFLQGQGIYLLDEQWYPVKGGDSIWMAPYCRQWFTAMGKQPSKYIYYKNVNRFPALL